MVIKRKSFNKILKDIKEVKIQGAKNIAIAAMTAYLMKPTNTTIKKLKSLRETEPLMFNVLKKLKKGKKKKEIDEHFLMAQDKINKIVFQMIKSNDLIYTHCHSTNITSALIYTKKEGKKFQVYNTETRPLYQGRKTAKELEDAGIKVTMFIDSAMDLALTKRQKTKRVSKIFIGADALLKEGAINKIGSRMLAKLAKLNKIELFVVADSWKYSKEKIKIEQRSKLEVWKNFIKNRNFEIKNPAFELVPKKLIKGIVTEYGLMKYSKFLKLFK